MNIIDRIGGLIYLLYNNALLIAFVLGAILLIVFARVFILWYFGIQKIIDNQEEIIKQLKLIAGQTRYRPPTP